MGGQRANWHSLLFWMLCPTTDGVNWRLFFDKALQIIFQFSASHAIIVIVSHILALTALSCCLEKEIIKSKLRRVCILYPAGWLLSLSLNVALFLFPSNSAKSNAQSHKRGVIRQAGLIAVICGCGPVLQCQRHLNYYPECFFLPMNTAERTFFSKPRRFRVAACCRVGCRRWHSSLFLCHVRFHIKLAASRTRTQTRFDLGIFLHAFCAPYYCAAV